MLALPANCGIGGVVVALLLPALRRLAAHRVAQRPQTTARRGPRPDKFSKRANAQ